MKRFKSIKRVIACVLVGVFAISCLAGCGSSKKLTGKTAAEIVDMMGIGINIGNTFDSTGGTLSNVLSLEKSWGNPEVTEEWIKGCKDAGFNTVRIPTTWYRAFTGESGFKISEEYLARIKEVVDWCYEYDMFVIINMHHEEWLNNENLVTNKNAIKTELICVWEQLADYFGDYDQHLIFEAMNEPRLADTSLEWTGNKEAYAVINEYNQVFVDTIRRSSKANNAERCLMIPGYAASSSYNIMQAIEIPQINGADAENIIVSVHSYTPYNFCLTDSQSTFGSSQDKKDIDYVFTSINSLFLSKGIPVVLGETSATNTGNNTEARVAWAEYFSAKAASYGVPIIVWDNGNGKTSGGECHVWVNRTTCTPDYPTVVDALFTGKNSVTWGSAR